jgi:methyl-accepting chemotaxis protein
MHVPIGYKFILGFLVVVGTVAFVPAAVSLLGYPPELTSVLSYLVALTIGLLLGWFFTRSFNRRIGALTVATQGISQGDLTCAVDVPASRFPDETEAMANALATMVSNLQSLVRQIREVSGHVSDSARTLSASALEINASTEEVAQAIEQISHGAENQAEMVGRSSKTIHEMAISIELVAKRAKESAVAARETSLTARRGGELANGALDRMKSFLDGVEASGRQFADLNAKLQQVGKIADVISEIARQTNMLALNASIEAVRAGEYGKGFAVVAEEVRKLADGTGKSAADIIDLVEQIKGQSQAVHAAFADSSRQIGEGKKHVDTTATVFAEILKTVMETERKANSIADLSQMQTQGAEKMVQAIDDIARVAEDNAASTEEVSAATEEQSAAMQEMAGASQELAQLATTLLQAVERFSIPAKAETGGQ